MDFKKYPKIELHLHLDSSLSYETAKRLDSSLTREKFTRSFIAPPKCNDLKDYLIHVARQVNLLQNKQALRLAAEDLVRRLKEDNIIYAEIRFAPLLHVREGLKPEDAVEAVNDAIRECTGGSSLRVNIILCTLRNFSEQQSMATAQLIKQFAGSNVVALDLAGDENGFPLDAHIPAYDFAHNNNIPRTAHAGEASGPESIWQTIEKLRPSRIGHGVRSFEDPKLLDYLKEHNIHLEVCPTSNIQTDVYQLYADHTVSKLLEAGISLSINTDGKTTSDVSLSEEYQKLSDAFGWDKKHFLSCNLQALNAAFIHSEQKQVLKQILEEGYQ